MSQSSSRRISSEHGPPVVGSAAHQTDDFSAAHGGGHAHVPCHYLLYKALGYVRRVLATFAAMLTS